MRGLKLVQSDSLVLKHHRTAPSVCSLAIEVLLHIIVPLIHMDTLSPTAHLSLMELLVQATELLLLMVLLSHMVMLDHHSMACHLLNLATVPHVLDMVLPSLAIMALPSLVTMVLPSLATMVHLNLIVLHNQDIMELLNQVITHNLSLIELINQGTVLANQVMALLNKVTEPRNLIDSLNAIILLSSDLLKALLKALIIDTNNTN